MRHWRCFGSSLNYIDANDVCVEIFRCCSTQLKYEKNFILSPPQTLNVCPLLIKFDIFTTMHVCYCFYNMNNSFYDIFYKILNFLKKVANFLKLSFLKLDGKFSKSGDPLMVDSLPYWGPCNFVLDDIENYGSLPFSTWIEVWTYFALLLWFCSN